jgi:ABC-2 type transport system permease protein
MNPAFTIAKKEYDLSLRSITTYIIFVIYLAATGLYFAQTIFKVGLAELRGVFSVMHLLFLFYIPAITMGSVSKETGNGTLELLSTLPIRIGHIVWGKFLAALMLLKTALLFTLVYLMLIAVYGIGIDYGAIVTGYMGLLFAGAAYISIGIFASTLSSNQVLSFIVACAISALFYVTQYISLALPDSLANITDMISFDHHLQNFLRGVIDTREILFFIVIILIFNYLAALKLQTRNLMQER